MRHTIDVRLMSYARFKPDATQDPYLCRCQCDQSRGVIVGQPIALQGESTDCVSSAVAASVSSECRGKAIRSDFLCREGGNLLDCSVGGLRFGPATTGLQLRGEGVSALPH